MCISFQLSIIGTIGFHHQEGWIVCLKVVLDSSKLVMSHQACLICVRSSLLVTNCLLRAAWVYTESPIIVAVIFKTGDVSRDRWGWGTYICTMINKR